MALNDLTIFSSFSQFFLLFHISHLFLYSVVNVVSVVSISKGIDICEDSRVVENKKWRKNCNFLVCTC
jgi:hypothetical protein